MKHESMIQVGSKLQLKRRLYCQTWPCCALTSGWLQASDIAEMCMMPFKLSIGCIPQVCCSCEAPVRTLLRLTTSVLQLIVLRNAEILD